LVLFGQKGTADVYTKRKEIRARFLYRLIPHLNSRQNGTRYKMIKHGGFVILCIADVEDDRLLTDVISKGRGMDQTDLQEVLKGHHKLIGFYN